jgi:GDP-D-mannose dehydratase
MIVQQDEPDDYVLATGERHSVREFVERAFACVDLDIEWRGSGVEERGIHAFDRDELWSKWIRVISARPKLIFWSVTPRGRGSDSAGGTKPALMTW